jgi:hypothetical protein
MGGGGRRRAWSERRELCETVEDLIDHRCVYYKE